MPNLLLCMTPGVGLNTWKKNGTLNRELKPYIEYVRRGWNVKILTYDKEGIPVLPSGISVVRFPNHWHWFIWFLPWTHNYIGKWADVIKTNQSVHSYFYVFAARIWKKPILLRCGYVRGEYLETVKGHTVKTKIYQFMESFAFKLANFCQVPTKELSGWVQKRYRVSNIKINIVPNFVDIDLFKPIKGIQKKEKSVISVGRLEPVKRFDLLIKSCSQISGCNLTIIGEGSDRSKLEQLAEELKVNVNLPGNVPNEKLPEILNQHQVFAITSKREGHPKTLIEAMACGLACICFDVIGVNNIINNGCNGLLIEPDSSKMKAAIIKLFQDDSLCNKLSQSARMYIKNKYSFLKCFGIEYKIITGMIQ